MVGKERDAADAKAEAGRRAAEAREQREEEKRAREAAAADVEVARHATARMGQGGCRTEGGTDGNVQGIAQHCRSCAQRVSEMWHV